MMEQLGSTRPQLATTEFNGTNAGKFNSAAGLLAGGYVGPTD